MKKFKKNAAIVAVTLLFAGTAFASATINGTTQKVETNSYIETKVVSNSEENLSAAFENAGNVEDSFQIDATAVNAVKKLENAVNMSVEKENRFQALRELATFEEEYNLSDDERDKFEQWLSEGKDYRLLMYIYEFWTTTNEDISIIGNAYDMFVRNYDERMNLPQNRSLWFEGIFKSLTNNKYGEITSEDIDEYMEAGLEIGDIRLAERISRAGVKEVHELLNERKNDISWSSIAAEVYDMPELLAYPEIDITVLQDVLTLSKITGENASAILKKAENSSTTELMNQHLEDSRRKADNAIIIAGLWEFDTSEEKSAVMEAVSNGIEPIKALSDIKASEDEEDTK